MARRSRKGRAGRGARGARRRRETAAPASSARPRGFGAAEAALLACAFLGVVLIVYRPALGGPFLSDDIHYVAANPYVHALSLENVRAILSPFGPATVAVVNYAPVQLLLHATVWQFFGDWTVAHHVANCALHALASLLLAVLFARCGFPRTAALLAGLFFLLHPANVEAVAWISQLKSSSAMVLLLAALLAYPRRPLAGTLLFGLSLLAKATSAVGIPAAFGLEWTRTGRVRWRWLAAWTGLFALYALVEFTAHQRAGAAAGTLYDTPFVLVRTVVAIGARYLVMAFTSWGVSAFQEPEPARSLLDPWWLGGCAAGIVLAWRLVVSIRARRQEAVWWTWALVGFAPVSQIFPFLYPVADRYLYFMLPGLLGGVLCAGRDLASRIPSERRVLAARAAVVVPLAACAGLAVHARARAAIWRSPAFVVADAARHYPDGVSAQLLRAKAAAQRGDAKAAVDGIRGAMARGYNRYEQLESDPAFQPIVGTPEFRAVLRDMARMWVEAGAAWEDPTQMELRKLASAYALLGDRDRAVELLRRALEVGGPLDAAIREDLGGLGARTP